MKCSIIIVTYNAKEDTKVCLETLFKTPLPDTYEVVLFDNQSSDGVIEVLKQYENTKNVKVIYNTENFGFAHGNNEAIKHAVGGYLFLLNPDTEIVISEIEKLVQYLDNHPTVGVVGPKIYDAGGLVQESYGADMTFLSELVGKIFGSVYIQNIPFVRSARMKYFDKKEITSVGWIGGAALMIKRELFNTIGGIDSHFFYSAGDMVDLCASVKEQKLDVVFFPDATMKHKGGSSTAKDKVAALKKSYEGTLYFFKKHKGAYYAFCVRLLYSLVSLIKGLIAGVVFLCTWQKKYKDITKSHLSNLT